MSRVLVGAKFTDKSSLNKTNAERVSKGKKKVTLSGKIDYISRKEASINNSKFFKETKEGYLSRELASENHDTFFVNKTKEAMYYNNDGAVYREDFQTRNMEIRKLNEHEKLENMCLYQTFISFDDVIESKIRNQYTEDELYSILKVEIEKYLLKNGFDLYNIKYFMAFHTNTNHFHCHFDFYEIEPTRDKNVLPRSNIDYLERNIALQLDDNIRLRYNKILDEIKYSDIKREENINNFKKDIRKALSKVELKELQNYLSSNYVPYYGSIKDENIKLLIDKICNSIDLDLNAEYKLAKLNNSVFSDKKAYELLTNKINRIETSAKNTIFKELRDDLIKSVSLNVKHEDFKRIFGNDSKFTKSIGRELNYSIKNIQYMAMRSHIQKLEEIHKINDILYNHSNER